MLVGNVMSRHLGVTAWGHHFEQDWVVRWRGCESCLLDDYIQAPRHLANEYLEPVLSFDVSEKGSPKEERFS